MDLSWRDVADIVGAAIMGLLTIIWRNLNGDVRAARAVADAALPKSDFLEAMMALEKGRSEFREGQIKLFERADSQEKLVAAKFEGIVKDFNGGLNRLSEKIGDAQINILTQLNNKVDRNA